MTGEGSFEDFNCTKCHRHIVGCLHFIGWPALCDQCLMTPGWYRGRWADLPPDTFKPEGEL